MTMLSDPPLVRHAATVDPALPPDPTTPRTSSGDERPPRRRSWSGTILLPPWTRAPKLAFRSPAVVLAVIGASAILACASASPALFLSSASSKTLNLGVAAECDDAAYPAITAEYVTGTERPDQVAAKAVPAAMLANGLAEPSRTLVTTGSAAAQFDQQQTLAKLFYGDGATKQVTILSGGTEPGVLVPAAAATRLGVGVGDKLTWGGHPVTVSGTYQNLFDEPLRPYWCSNASLFQNLGSVDPPPPALFIATSPEVFGAARASSGAAATDFYTSPIDTSHITASQADELIADRDAAIDDLSGVAASPGVRFLKPAGQLVSQTERADLVTSGLRGPVLPIAIGGSLLALLLVGAAGSYWADRRSKEVRLLSSRGVGPAALAAKAGLELLLPAFVGAVLGWGMSIGLIRWLGPSSDLDPSAPVLAALTAGATFILGMLLLGLVAGLRARSTVERPIGKRRSWPALVPWELALFAGALACWIPLNSAGGASAVVVTKGVTQVSLLVVAFPLLFLAGAALLVVRLLVFVLPILRKRLTRLSPAVYLALSRISASRVISGVLLAAVAMPVAMAVYSAALTDTSQTTIQAKARVAVGSTEAILSIGEVTATPALDRLATVVRRYQYVTIDGQDAELLAIDPQTFGREAFWDDRFADQPLAEILDLLSAPARSGAVPAAVVGAGTGEHQLQLGAGGDAAEHTLDVVSTPTVFPGYRQNMPLIIVTQDAIGDVPRSAGALSELWTTHGIDKVSTALTEDGIRIWDTRDEATVFRVGNYLSVSWTFGYLQALAALAGAIAIGGLLLYVETRQRSRTASYAMARRMGLSKTAHLRSLFVELGTLLGVAAVAGAALAWVAVLLVYGWLDVDADRPPAPLLTVPTVTLIAGVVAALAVAIAASLYAQRAANRADMAEVLRLAS